MPSLLDQLTIHSFIPKCYQGTHLHLGELPMKETGSLSPLSLLGQAVAGMHSDYTDKDVILWVKRRSVLQKRRRSGEQLPA